MKHFIISFINNRISVRLGHWLYYTYCVVKCKECQGSGMICGANNSCADCDECEGTGLIEIDRYF
jgi:hypothetical protein